MDTDVFEAAADRVAKARGKTPGPPPPVPTIEKLLLDVGRVLEESLPPFEAALGCTLWELAASITIKIAFKPATEGTDMKAGKAAQVVVSGKVSLPTTEHEHDAHPSDGQLTLFG